MSVFEKASIHGRFLVTRSYSNILDPPFSSQFVISGQCVHNDTPFHGDVAGSEFTSHGCSLDLKISNSYIYLYVCILPVKTLNLLQLWQWWIDVRHQLSIWPLIVF